MINISDKAMSVNKEKYTSIIEELANKATLVAVSKTKPAEDIQALYDLGQKDFGENYVQELIDKQSLLPTNIHWHFIGHLQSNKVKYIAPFVYLIHGVDSFNLLQEINKQAAKNNRTIHCLLQIYIAREETKFGLDEKELNELIDQLATQPFNNITIVGLMGMASFSEDKNLIKNEFNYLKRLFNKTNPALSAINHPLSIISMGMSSDYKIAIEEGSTMVRIGSLLFGERNYSK
ncbi:MAG TPA: YggS family pyridoxal phosphate-dependent enzyme [Ferruginibacter sp.]|jgi:pyridoxal phosphate enzyme (YggS family)|nr:YggS family pyridoxal phosphate-dependent enzyme [Ferruginibacter sp.]